MERNTWFEKLKRTWGALFPVDPVRSGECRQCGACCSLPVRCWFLRSRQDGTSYCAIYSIRPLNCRKYPRTAGECITGETCGFYFTDNRCPES